MDQIFRGTQSEHISIKSIKFFLTVNQSKFIKELQKILRVDYAIH
jgi:hypothetical protein